MTIFFDATSATKGRELFKLGNDGSVTLWTDINPGSGDSDPFSLTPFNNALWFAAFDGASEQLYKLGADGSVTKWTDINSGGGLNRCGQRGQRAVQAGSGWQRHAVGRYQSGHSKLVPEQHDSVWITSVADLASQRPSRQLM